MDCGVTRWLLFVGYTTDIIRMGNPFSLEKTETEYLKRSWQCFKKISQSCLRENFRMLQGLSRYWSPIFETLTENTGSSNARKNRFKIPSEAVKLQNICMKNKSHCTLLETPQHLITYQTCVEGRKYIFCSLQYNLWHSSGKRMKNLL